MGELVIGRRLSIYRTKTMVALRDFGIKHTLRRILEEVLLGRFYLSRQFIIYDKQLTELDRLRLQNPDLEFSFISENSYEIIQQIEELSGFPREIVSKKLMDGSECLVARDNNKLVGFNLVSYGNVHIPSLDLHLMLAGSEAWSEQITISLPYRRSGVASDLRHIMFHHLSNKEYTKLTGGYVPFNQGSGMLAKELGFVEREKVTFVKILKWKKYSVQRLSGSHRAVMQSPPSS